MDEDTADPSSTILAQPAVAGWLADAVAIEDRSEATCDEITEMAPTMSAAVARRVIRIPEPVLQEVILNLDAVIGSTVVLCGRGRAPGALREWAEARALAGILAARIEELA